MAEQKKVVERLVALVCLGLVAMNYPLLNLFSKNKFFCGVPLLYFYIFSLWFLFIVVLALVMRKRISSSSAPGNIDLGRNTPD